MTSIPVFTPVLSGLILHLALPLVAVAGIPVAVVGGILGLRGESPGQGALSIQGPEIVP